MKPCFILLYTIIIIVQIIFSAITIVSIVNSPIREYVINCEKKYHLKLLTIVAFIVQNIYIYFSLSFSFLHKINSNKYNSTILENKKNIQQDDSDINWIPIEEDNNDNNWIPIEEDDNDINLIPIKKNNDNDCVLVEENVDIRNSGSIQDDDYIDHKEKTKPLRYFNYTLIAFLYLYSIFSVVNWNIVLNNGNMDLIVKTDIQNKSDMLSIVCNDFYKRDNTCEFPRFIKNRCSNERQHLQTLYYVYYRWIVFQKIILSFGTIVLLLVVTRYHKFKNIIQKLKNKVSNYRNQLI